MMSNNKILTVSYGTFSCTLEGFEDSFDTMKAIAEYFRDLAAEDRYFGAEPPQPDAEMLARIAEREIERRVEAHQKDGAIVLRAGAASAALGAAAAVPAAQAAAPQTSAHDAKAPATQALSEDVTPYQAAADEGAHASVMTEATPAPIPEIREEPVPAAAEVETADVADVPTTQADPALVPDADIAAFMQQSVQPETAYYEEDAATTDSAPDAALLAGIAHHADAPEAEAEVAWDTSAQDLEEDLEEVVAAEAGLNEVEESEFDAPEAPVQEVEAAVTTEVPQEIDAAAENLSNAADTTEPAPDAEMDADEEGFSGIAAKLQRIRDVVARNKSDTDDGFEEEQAAEDLPQIAPHSAEDEAEEAGDATQTFAMDGWNLDDADTAELDEDEGEDLRAEAEAPAPASTPFVLSAMMTADLAQTDDADDSDDDDMDVADHDAYDPEETSSAEETETVLAHDAAHSEDDDLDDADDDVFGNLGAALDNDEPVAPEADAAETVQPRVRVVQVKSEIFEDYDDEEDFDNLLGGTALSAEDEAELQRDLAAVEAELEGTAEAGVSEDDYLDEDEDEDDDVAVFGANDTGTVYDDDDEDDLENAFADLDEDFDEEDSEDAAEANDAAPAHQLDDVAQIEEEDLDRLMAEADSQMKEPEGSNRRSAFDHLRAAVAATRADDKLSAEVAPASDDEYRSDLANVVRPRRPVSRTLGRSERPEAATGAPLKLVAEQRVDSSNSAASGPVRPRRIAQQMGDAAGGEGADSFADYAAERGAHELPDLLEAAASYLSFVEGREQFSRPQLMTKVRQAEKGDFSREDSLRTFGQLLRTGKIEKLRGGRFTVSEDIGFRPDDQRAAG